MIIKESRKENKEGFVVENDEGMVEHTLFNLNKAIKWAKENDCPRVYSATLDRDNEIVDTEEYELVWSIEDEK